MHGSGTTTGWIRCLLDNFVGSDGHFGAYFRETLVGRVRLGDQALVTFSREAGRRKQALEYARQLQQLVPDNPSVDQLVQELEAAGG
jgi:hypothetical protein